MQCKEAMVPREKFITLDENATIVEGMEALVTNRVGSIVVMEEDIPLGIVTSKDLMTIVVIKGDKGLKAPLTDVMSSKLLTIHENDSLKKAVSKMEEVQTHHILVRNGDNEIVGIISSFDIIREAMLNNLIV